MEALVTPLRAVTGPTVLSWADLMAEPAIPPPVLRPGVPVIGVTVLAGPPKAGKTLLASQWALEAGRRTLLVELEGDLRGLSYRLRTQAAALGLTDPPVSVMHRQRLRLDDQAAVRKLYDMTGGYDLIVIDPLNRAHSADENRPTEMTRVMDGLASIAYGRQTAVLAIHHLSKPSAERRGDPWDRFRGASSIRSGTDANLILDGSGDRMRLVGEFRDAEPLSEWLELDRTSLTFRTVGAPDAPAKIDPTALRQYVIERGQVRAQEVAVQFGASKNTAFDALRAIGCDEFAGVRGALSFTLRTGQ